MIKLVRIDHRLLHGQVVFSWSKFLISTALLSQTMKLPMMNSRRCR